MSVLGTTKHSSCNQCIDTWQESYCMVLYMCACVGEGGVYVKGAGGGVRTVVVSHGRIFFYFFNF